MQYLKYIKGVKPLIIASAVSVGAPSAYANFDMVDIKTNIIAENRDTSNYLNTLKDDSSQIFFKVKFDLLLQKWQNETMFSSSPKQIIENPSFQAIVSMGKAAVPYILPEIDEEPSTLVWALNLIYNKKISNNPQNTIPEACRLWVKSLN